MVPESASGGRRDRMRELVRLLCGTALALAVAGLGVFALAQGVLHARPLLLVQGLVPVLLGGWSLHVLALFWRAWFGRR